MAQPGDTEIQSVRTPFRLAELAIPAAQQISLTSILKETQRTKKSVSPDAEETLQPEQKGQVRADAPTFPERLLRTQRASPVANPCVLTCSTSQNTVFLLRKIRDGYTKKNRVNGQCRRPTSRLWIFTPLLDCLLQQNQTADFAIWAEDFCPTRRPAFTSIPGHFGAFQPCASGVSNSNLWT